MAISCTGVLLALLFAWSFAQDNTVVTLYDGADCASEASQAIWEPGAQDATSDGNCVMRLPATALSLMFSELLPGCTVTVYSDVYCSYNATLAELDLCTELGDSLQIRSFSIDGCDVPFSESANGTSDQQDRGLSTAAEAGIGVGVSCGILLIMAAGFLVWFKRRRSRTRVSHAREEKSPDEPTELPGEQIFELNTARGTEMSAEKEKHEMEAKRSMAELRAKSSLRIVVPQELEGDHP